ncbi:MAG: PAS domain S-box protein [Rhodoferax sp.]|nr:PAS domain S-box protein [Pseudorhodobacter sp.]
MASLKDSDLQKAAQATISPGFEFVILNGYSILAGTMPHAVEPGNRLQSSKVMNVFGQSWSLTIWPSEAYIVSRRTLLQNMTLLFGLLTAALVGLTLIQTRRGKFNQDRADALSVRLATTLENISDAFMTIDRSRRVTYANAEAVRLGQRQIGEFIPLPQPDVPGNPAMYQMAAGLSRALEGTSSVRFTSLLRKTGLWVEANSYPIPNGVAMHFRDITEERARAAHLRMLETAIARQNDVLIIAEVGDSSHPQAAHTVYANDAFTRLTGYSVEEVLGKSPSIMQGPMTDKAELKRIGETLSRGEPVQAELRNYRKDGTEYWVEIDISPIFDDIGRCTHFVAVERDVTRRRMAVEEMSLAQERFHRLAEATNEIVWDADFVTGTIWFNENFHLILGYDPSRGVPTVKGWQALIHPDDLDRFLQTEADARRSNAPQCVTEYRLARADGSYAKVVDRAKMIRDDKGAVIRMLGGIEDVTERRAMTARLHQSQQLEVIGHLTGGVAHDFNNLLTVILGSVKLLSDRLTDQPKLKNLAETAISAALRGADMISRLLSFARRQPLDPKVVEVSRQLDTLTEWLKRALPESIAIDISSAKDVWLVEVDPTQLETALLNIAVNARDAMPEGGQLVIRAENRHIEPTMVQGIPEAIPGDYVCISVSDTGVGMDAQTIARAFERFFTTKNIGKGSGLGLSMVYGFVRQSLGFAQIHSTEGEGTSVQLYFPRSIADRSTEIARASVEATPGGTECVLVVEDDDMLRDNVVTQLTQLGYRVSSAAAGSAALIIMRQKRGIDLLFTDIVMPGDMSGPELVTGALAIRPDLKVLYTSGYSHAEITHDGRLDQGVQLLTKPYRLADMAHKIRAVLEA